MNSFVNNKGNGNQEKKERKEKTQREGDHSHTKVNNTHASYIPKYSILINKSLTVWLQ